MSRENILYKIHPVAFGCSSRISIQAKQATPGGMACFGASDVTRLHLSSRYEDK